MGRWAETLKPFGTICRGNSLRRVFVIVRRWLLRLDGRIQRGP